MDHQAAEPSSHPIAEQFLPETGGTGGTGGQSTSNSSPTRMHPGYSSYGNSVNYDQSRANSSHGYAGYNQPQMQMNERQRSSHKHADSDPYEGEHHHQHLDPNRRLSQEAPHGLGETEEQHAQHSAIPPKPLWGLSEKPESALFYVLMVLSIGCEIAAAVCGVYYHSWGYPFIGTMTAFLALHWWAWLQTAVRMAQRASWVRDEGDLVTRRQYLYLAVRLNRLMLPTALVALVTFIQAYARRFDLNDLAYWLLFLLAFIWNIVFSVMNAYNNITWESDRLEFEEGEHPFRLSRLAILGIPSSSESVKLAREEGKLGTKGTKQREREERKEARKMGKAAAKDT